MGSLAEIAEAGSPLATYLEEVVRAHRDVLGDDLIALYLHGSLVQDDFKPGSSDIDILGVVAGPIPSHQRSELAAKLSHKALPVPAFGLELILCALDAVRAPTKAMPYEFALSTGEEWGADVETDGETSDILVHMQLCRQSGLALIGEPAANVLTEVPATVLRAGLMGELLWHQEELRSAPDAQSVTNAVLNAARSLYAAETGEILSKTQGAKWWLSQAPDEVAVAAALDYRYGHCTKRPSLQSARKFVEFAIAQL